MDAVKEYVIGLIAAAAITSLILGFAGKGRTEPLLKLICGLVLSYAMLDPILKISMKDFESLGLEIRDEAREITQSGAQEAEKNLRAIIKAETESYILDKARELGLEPEVSVTLNDQKMPAPYSVVIRGKISPYLQSQLSRILTRELGIEKGRQEWIF